MRVCQEDAHARYSPAPDGRARRGPGAPRRASACPRRRPLRRPLRRLLAPKTARSDAPRQLVKVIHITPDELTQEVLADARLVVVAGIQDPGDSVPLLREYVAQGGQLVIAAGGNFDPDAWNAAGYAGGQGILPLPLAKDPLGEVPEVAGANVQVFRLAFDSLSGEELN